jgi:polyisoprenoid-binding protein YceI
MLRINRLPRLTAPALAACALLAALPAHAEPKTAALTGQAKFSSDAPLEKIVGTADGGGEIKLDPADPASVKGKLTMSVKSMKTGNDMRDDHLRSADWLDADKCPDITFEISSATVKSQKTEGDVTEVQLEVVGNFGLHCKTAPLTAPVTLKWKGDKLKADTKFQVKLGDYEVKGREGVVGSKVGTTIEVETSLKGVLQ